MRVLHLYRSSALADPNGANEEDARSHWASHDAESGDLLVAPQLDLKQDVLHMP